MNPARSIIGTTQMFSLASPTRIKSVAFIAISIATIEIKDIPRAVLSATEKIIWRDKIIVSSITEVIRPFIMAKLMTVSAGT